MLAEWLVARTSLKNLNLSQIQFVTASGWAKCVGMMVLAELVLGEVNLHSTNIDDEGATLLTNLLAKTSTLISLKIQYCHYYQWVKCIR